MEQTFFSYVLTDLRFVAGSGSAVLRALSFPAVVFFGLLAVLGASEAAFMAATVALTGVCIAEWAVLVCRMARRIALDREDPERIVRLSTGEVAAYLRRSYY